MIEVPLDTADIRYWYICESGERWIAAANRFASRLMPGSLVPSVVSDEAGEIIKHLKSQHAVPAVAIWESDDKSLLPICDWIMETARVHPGVLQIVAAQQRSAQERLMLGELPCATIIRHPEDLIGLETMVCSHFLRGRQR